jgi:hypothetical protein
MSVLAIHPIVITGIHWLRVLWFQARENSQLLSLISLVTTGSGKSGLEKKNQQVGGSSEPFFTCKQYGA